MEHTTEGTISYLLSISWSHFRPILGNPRSWLVDVIVAQLEGGGFKGRKEGREGKETQGFLAQLTSPMETCLPTNRRCVEKGDGEGPWE